MKHVIRFCGPCWQVKHDGFLLYRTVQKKGCWKSLSNLNTSNVIVEKVICSNSKYPTDRKAETASSKPEAAEKSDHLEEFCFILHWGRPT